MGSHAKSREIKWGHTRKIGKSSEPPRFENNTLFMRPYAQMPQNTGAVALWAYNENVEDKAEFLWVFDDKVFPDKFAVRDWNSFFFFFLGSGNTLVFIDD